MRHSVATERDNAACPATIRPPAFVGRERELAALTQALGGEPAVVLVEGEAGIGKTRLVREFLTSPGGRHHSPLVATCPPFRQPHTFGPIADGVRQATAGRLPNRELSRLAGALRPLFPEWEADLPPAPNPAEDASAARHRVFTALAELLVALDTRMLMVEDLHWADEATVEFLLFLASVQPQQVSLLVTYRPDDVPEGSLVRRLSRHAAGATGLRIGLPPLTVDQTVDLVSSMLAVGRVSEEFAEFLHERTEGLPMAVEESVRLMGDRADLTFRHGNWARRHLPDIEVPPTVRDAVLERAARLDMEAMAVLRAAAVLGEPTVEPVLVVVVGLAHGEVRAGLGEALGSGLLVENRSPHGQTVAFRHALAARAVYDAIPPPLRRDMHQRAGQALQDSGPVSLAGLAHHFREAGDSGLWSEYGERAADAALAAGDHRTAAVVLNDLVVHAGLPPGQVVRLACKVPVMALAGYASIADLAQSVRSVLVSGGLTARQQAEARWRLGQILIDTGDYAAGAAELEQAIPGLADRPVKAAHAMAWLGWPLHGLWPAAEHRHWLDRAAVMAADPSVSASDRQKILSDRTTALLIMGDDEGWAQVAGLPQDASDPRVALLLAIDWMNAGEAAMYWGRYTQARQALTIALRLADQYQYPRVRDPVQVSLAHLDWFTGAWDGLSGPPDGLLTDLSDAEPLTCVEATLIAGLLDATAGATGSAKEKLRQVLEEQARRGTAFYVQEAAAALARLRLAEGEAGEAVALTDEPVEIITAKGIWLWATDVAPIRVEALAAAGRVAEAGDLVRAFADGLRCRDAPAPQAALLACRAILAAAHDRHLRAAGLFGRASKAWEVLPRPYDALLAQERQGGCLLAAGKDQAGLGLLAHAREGLYGLGAVRDSDRVAQSLRGNGVKVATKRGHRRSYGDQLSPRELEVVRLLVAGRTVREIAGTLFLSPKTVDCHVDSARRKLNVSSRAALAAAAVGSGILPAQRASARAQK
jgi:DNA-binding CsgD family transcriptional regulator/tetratricopeptide (TPR) repeat protein